MSIQYVHDIFCSGLNYENVPLALLHHYHSSAYPITTSVRRISSRCLVLLSMVKRMLYAMPGCLDDDQGHIKHIFFFLSLCPVTGGKMRHYVYLPITSAYSAIVHTPITASFESIVLFSFSSPIKSNNINGIVTYLLDQSKCNVTMGLTCWSDSNLDLLLHHTY